MQIKYSLVLRGPIEHLGAEMFSDPLGHYTNTFEPFPGHFGPIKTFCFFYKRSVWPGTPNPKHGQAFVQFISFNAEMVKKIKCSFSSFPFSLQTLERSDYEASGAPRGLKIVLKLLGLYQHIRTVFQSFCQKGQGLMPPNPQHGHKFVQLFSSTLFTTPKRL